MKKENAIAIKYDDDLVYVQRLEPKTGSDVPLQPSEKIIISQYNENKKLKVALKFYADKNHIAHEKEMCGDQWEAFQNRRCYACVEDGFTAREALNE